MPSSAPLPGRCGIKLKARTSNPTGEGYCSQWPVTGRERCKMHGGKQPRGMEAANWRGRGYSRDLPTQLADRFNTALSDPDLTNLASEIALVDARLGQLFVKLPTGEVKSAWDAARDAVATLEGAMARNDMDSATNALQDLRAAFSTVQREHEAWGEIYLALELRRRLADTERKREEMLALTMTAKQVMTLVGAIQAAILSEVTEQPVRERLTGKLRTLLMIPARTGE